MFSIALTPDDVPLRTVTTQKESSSPYDLSVRGLVVVCLIAGCRDAAPPPAPPPPPGPPRGTFALTYYWMSVPPAAGTADTRLYARDCSVLATVPAAYAKAMTES